MPVCHQIINELANLVNNDQPLGQDWVVFVENYRSSQVIIPAANLSEQISLLE